METKLNEVIQKTSDLEKMKGNYTSGRLLRSWKEDFVDDDSGEVVSIERNEVILLAGTYIDEEVISEISFFIQSGDIKEVTISNQKRKAIIISGMASVWSVKGLLNDKPRTLFLYARDLEEALKISSDYIEQSYEGSFFFKEIKVLGLTNMITDYKEVVEETEGEVEPEEEVSVNFYKMQVQIFTEGIPPYNDVFVIKSTDADEAKEQIIKYISVYRNEQKNFDPFTVTTLSATVLRCDEIIPLEFSNEYINQ